MVANPRPDRVVTASMSDISHQIWDMKYRLKAPDGTPMDRDVADSWTRVALALADAERHRPTRLMSRLYITHDLGLQALFE